MLGKLFLASLMSLICKDHLTSHLYLTMQQIWILLQKLQRCHLMSSTLLIRSTWPTKIVLKALNCKPLVRKYGKLSHSFINRPQLRLHWPLVKQLTINTSWSMPYTMEQYIWHAWKVCGTTWKCNEDIKLKRLQEERKGSHSINSRWSWRTGQNNGSTGSSERWYYSYV